MTNDLHDLHDLLGAASADVPDVDFAERAWTGARQRRTRARRRTALGAGAAVAVALVVGTQLVDHGSTPPPASPLPSVSTSATQTPWRVAADGTRYAVAPASGTESSLPRAGFPGLDTVDPRSTRRDLKDLVRSDPRWQGDTPVAVFLEAVDAPTAAEATVFQPVFARVDGTLVTTQVRLGVLRDAAGNSSVPLSVGSLSLRLAAFPQPGKVVVVDLDTAKVTTYPVPSATIQQVRWVRNGSDKVVASGPDGAWLVDTAAGAPGAERLPDGYTGADNTMAAAPGGLRLTNWELEGLKRTAQSVTAPVTGVVGQTFSSNLTAASGVLLDDTLEPVDGVRGTQGVISVTTYDTSARSLLVMGDSPARQKGCCQVVGLSAQRDPIYTSATAEGLWLLQWDPESGAVGRVLLLEPDPGVPSAISLGFNFSS